MFRVVGDRAHHTTRSYDYGIRLATRTAVARLGSATVSDEDAHIACRQLVALQSYRPSWLVDDEAIEGCADMLTK